MGCQDRASLSLPARGLRYVSNTAGWEFGWATFSGSDRGSSSSFFSPVIEFAQLNRLDFSYNLLGSEQKVVLLPKKGWDIVKRLGGFIFLKTVKSLKDLKKISLILEL